MWLRRNWARWSCPSRIGSRGAHADFPMHTRHPPAIRFVRQVVLTELAVAIPLLHRNLAANAGGAAHPPRACVLPWGESLPPETADLVCGRHIDLVVGADIVYDEQLYEPLLQTLGMVTPASLARPLVGSPLPWFARCARGAPLSCSAACSEARILRKRIGSTRRSKAALVFR